MASQPHNKAFSIRLGIVTASVTIQLQFKLTPATQTTMAQTTQFIGSFTMKPMGKQRDFDIVDVQNGNVRSKIMFYCVA